MITHSHRWPYPMLPSPRNPCQDQSQQNCCMSSQEDAPCPSSKKDENKIIDMQSEYFVSLSPQLQVNSEIIGNCGFKVEEQNHSLDLSVGSSQKQVKTIGNLIESISFDRKKQIKRRRKQVGLEKTDNMKSASCQQSKCWNEEQSKLFYELVQKYGTDFNFIKQFFPNKSKSQIKNKHKELFNMEKKNKRKFGENKEKVAKKEERLMVLVSTAQSEAMKKTHQEESEISH